MRELTPVEMQNVSGAGFFDRVAAMVVGGVTGTTTFGLKWAISGGSTGGVLGAGIISAGVGLIVGAGFGLVDGALYGLIYGWQKSVDWFSEFVSNQFDPKGKVISV